MGCNCKWTEVVLGLVVIVFTWWQLGAIISQWIVTVAGALLIIHAMKCDNCKVDVSGPSSKSGKRKKK